ncbi:MAG: radical SAM protein [Candidatus Margulisbacteria bacterium]|nr:radical SAM protein [Candidatus Margulisiibacteriota bacterium]
MKHKILSLNCNIENFICENSNEATYLPYDYIKYFYQKLKPYINNWIKNIHMPPYELEWQISSQCNLRCVYCIGSRVSTSADDTGLKDVFTEDNVIRVAHAIAKLEINNLRVSLVKFSGLRGDPLHNKIRRATIKAMKALIETQDQIDIALFTNGQGLTKRDGLYEALRFARYINISLDAGLQSYMQVKRPKDKRNNFTNVINNISEFINFCCKNNSETAVNLSFVIIPENIRDISSVINIARDCGANAIRFKCDIGEQFLLNDSQRDRAYEQIEKAISLFATDKFVIHTTHSAEECKNKTYRLWKQQYPGKCYFYKFFSTIASDGNIYLCDHNSLKGAYSPGNVLREPFNELWEKISKGEFSTAHCYSKVCPPFANSSNFLLEFLWKHRKNI